jgi:NhaC family Na+:H+ antiporter
MNDKTTQPGVFLAVTPVLFLVISLASAVVLFGDATTGGPGQIALMLSGVVAVLIVIRNGIRWLEL